jgi:2-amino-4-hydroxy-6-hydroxymethyldihydropteridine diphosphokinase
MSSNPYAYVGLGSNLGDRAENLRAGIRALTEAGFVVTRLSQIYETEPVETFAQPKFLNMVAELDIKSLPAATEVLARLLQIEISLGRTRDTLKGPRTIDLDLLLHGDQSIHNETLTLPHPRLHLRRFVLAPLAELSPGLVHPTLNQTLAELLEGLADSSEVRLWTP